MQVNACLSHTSEDPRGGTQRTSGEEESEPREVNQEKKTVNLKWRKANQKRMRVKKKGGRGDVSMFRVKLVA